jgi:ComF family protein
LLTSFLSNVGSNKRCGSCEGLPFWSARSCGVYGGALEANILFLKSYPHICRRFREIIGQTLSVHSQALESDVIIPAPLHNSRRRERGFNQAEVIAAAVKHFARVEVDARSLVREKRTERHRAGMDAVDRARSIDGAFKVVRPRRIGGQSVLLVDDLLTTGCTLGEAARVLLDAGAGRVNALVLARVLTGRQRGQIGC